MQSHVRLVVYDMLGREVAVLVDGVEAAGRYRVDFAPSRLASGVYVYAIDIGPFRSVRKMVLVE